MASIAAWSCAGHSLLVGAHCVLDRMAAPCPLSENPDELRRCIAEAPAKIKDAVRKSLKDTMLKTLGPSETDCNLDDKGFSLRDNLTLRKLRHRTNPKLYPCGKHYYSELLITFRDPECAEAKLHESSKGPDVDEKLLIAMGAFRKTGQRGPVLSFIATATSLTASELAGVLSFASSLNPTASTRNSEQADNILEVLVRLRCKAEHPEVLSCCSSWIDSTLAWFFQKAKAVHISRKDFVRNRLEELALLHAKAELETLMPHFDDDLWHEDPDTLLDVVQTSLTGEKIFGFATTKVLHKKIENQVLEMLHDFIAEGVYSEAALHAKERIMHLELLKLPGIDKLCERRAVEFPYRGLPCKGRVVGLMQHCVWIRTVRLKELAVALL